MAAPVKVLLNWPSESLGVVLDFNISNVGY